MFHRERPEKEYAPLYKKYAIGTTVWSALASGLLTGKVSHILSSFNDFLIAHVCLVQQRRSRKLAFRDTLRLFQGHTQESKRRGRSRQDQQGPAAHKSCRNGFVSDRYSLSWETRAELYPSKELGCSVTHLALAWVAKNPNTSTVILGASKPEQVLDNLKALDVIPKLTPEIVDKIENILDNKPAPLVSSTHVSRSFLLTYADSRRLVVRHSISMDACDDIRQGCRLDVVECMYARSEQFTTILPVTRLAE